MTYSVVFRYLVGEEERASRPAPARDLPECSALARAFILNRGIGAGEWIAGEVYGGERPAARIAYNGRVIA